MVNDSVPSGHRVLQEIRDGGGEPDGVGGHGDGVGDGEHQTDGTSDRRTKGSRNHVVYTASGDLKKNVLVYLFLEKIFKCRCLKSI